jgi:small subunit ribosomal protein S2
VIPGNDDALRAIRLFASRIADAVVSGRGVRESAHADEGGEGGDADERARRGRPVRQPRSEQASPASV